MNSSFYIQTISVPSPPSLFRYYALMDGIMKSKRKVQVDYVSIVGSASSKRFFYKILKGYLATPLSYLPVIYTIKAQKK